MFASYGLAAYRAQLLEQRLAWVLSTAYANVQATVSREESRRILEERQADTFGTLLKHLRKHPAASPELVRKLEQHRDDRDYLVHRFFWPRAADLVKRESRTSLTAELKAMGERFKAANEGLREIYLDWLAARANVPRAEVDEVIGRIQMGVKSS